MNVPASNPAARAWVIAPSDNQHVSESGVPWARSLLASADCTVRVTMLGGDIVALPLQKGYNPVSVTQVWATGTSLGSAVLLGLY